MDDRILVKTREDLMACMDYFKSECVEAEEVLVLPDMLLNFYMYACAAVAHSCDRTIFGSEGIDWEGIVALVDHAKKNDGIYGRRDLEDLRHCVLLMRSADLIPEDVLSVFSRRHWSFEDLTGRIHELALKTIDFYAQVNELGNPFARSELTLPVVLRIQHVMNETVFNIPLYAYWWSVYLVTVRDNVLRGEYWERDLSDPQVMRDSLLEFTRILTEIQPQSVNLRKVADSVYEVPIPWLGFLSPVRLGLECLEVY